MNTFALIVGYAVIVGSTAAAVVIGLRLLIDQISMNYKFAQRLVAAMSLISRDRAKVEAEQRRLFRDLFDDDS